MSQPDALQSPTPLVQKYINLLLFLVLVPFLLIPTLMVIAYYLSEIIIWILLMPTGSTMLPPGFWPTFLFGALFASIFAATLVFIRFAVLCSNVSLFVIGSWLGIASIGATGAVSTFPLIIQPAFQLVLANRSPTAYLLLALASVCLGCCISGGEWLLLRHSLANVPRFMFTSIVGWSSWLWWMLFLIIIIRPEN